MSDISPSKQIDAIITQPSGWKGDVIRRLRAVIQEADSSITEEIKWKMPTRPQGLPVWTRNGIVCFIEIWNDNIKLLFFKGALLADSDKLFNARLKSSTLRAIELHEGDTIDKEGITSLVLAAVELNMHK